MIEQNFIKLYEDSFKENWDLPALSDYQGPEITYGEMSGMIARQHLLYKELAIEKGDKIALFGKNSANWCVAFMSAITYGAVTVPILADFKPEEATNIINHSDSVFLFTDRSFFEGLKEADMKNIKGVIDIEDFTIASLMPSKKLKDAFEGLDELFNNRYPEGFKREHLKFPEIDNKDLVEINYTSGTTGFSKGVMLSANSLAGNVMFARGAIELNSGEKMLAVLPLAHCYGCAFDLLFPMTKGVHLTILGKIPATPLLLKAFADVRPHLILFIPLFFEKLFKKRLLPTISKPTMKILLAIPGIRSILYGTIRKKLMQSFGGRFREAVLGGAPLSAEVEVFFRKIKFPFTIGYGMTECGPLISYDGWETSRPNSSGKILEGIMEMKIDSSDPHNEVGEILVRGENLMEGYYKNEEATKATIDDEGWLHTGDLGVIDKDGYIYIKGRSKSMLLGPSGQNIYPEEIEAQLNNLPYISESVVLMNDDHGIEALVYPDYEAAKADGVEGQIAEKMEENRKAINGNLKAYEGIRKIHIHEEEFIKTPKRSIKRFKYSLKGLK
ncbi:MAG: AMP-binding protein [Bacteroidales bacterium]|nr:AMP-binding protein [Bacteroidales bacterium]